MRRDKSIRKFKTLWALAVRLMEFLSKFKSKFSAIPSFSIGKISFSRLSERGFKRQNYAFILMGGLATSPAF